MKNGTDFDLIKARKARLGSTPTRREVKSQLDQLAAHWSTANAQNPQAPDSEALRATLTAYIPIRVVTLLELFFRSWVATLIDFGPPFLGNAKALDTAVRIDLEGILDLRSQNLTVGEMVSHFVVFDDFDSIRDVFTRLTGRDYLSTMRRAERFTATSVPDFAFSVQMIFPDFESTLSRLNRLYDLRAILARGLPSRQTHSFHETFVFIIDALDLFEATEGELSRIISSTPRQKRAGSGDLAETIKRLQSDVEFAAEVMDPYTLKQSQEAWDSYVEKQVRLALADPRHQRSTSMSHHMEHRIRLMLNQDRAKHLEIVIERHVAEIVEAQRLFTDTLDAER